ncbi:MAG: hypothetical protein HY764_04345 [Candidatus Portnoybacteria bacterium]|nr:hypothetical protein [Candidatus Portnoybacteria bacterium]
MLHFIFFDFIKKRYGIEENTKFKGKDAKYVWRVSETFNTTIENWKPYKDILNIKISHKSYPGCGRMYASMKKQWFSKQDINEFLDKWLLRGKFR